ncbi:hypothetical protein INT46_001493 [Mucor plumbeus]|uniref:Uncharacterized protein n=1 Tax=Mucor plumbeus TaxID=97098 RepID=A0A8H7RLT7_9FUNG|nr:hypothetical protein INT46_001493 [Mucor plumbeus]
MSLESLNDEIASQLLDLAGEAKQTVTMVIIKQLIAQTGKKKFKDVSKKLELNIIRDEEHVDVWTEKVTPQLFKNTTTSKSSSHTSSTSSLSY